MSKRVFLEEEEVEEYAQKCLLSFYFVYINTAIV